MLLAPRVDHHDHHRQSLLLPHLAPLLYHCLAFMSMTAEQAHRWLNDANEFIADAEDDMSSVRVSAALFIDELVLVCWIHRVDSPAVCCAWCMTYQVFGNDALEALNTVVQQRLQESAAAKAAGREFWWKPREAVCECMCVLGDVLCEAAQDGEQLPIDGAALMGRLLSEDVGSVSTPPLLLARVLWAAGRYVGDLRVLHFMHVDLTHHGQHCLVDLTHHGQHHRMQHVFQHVDSNTTAPCTLLNRLVDILPPETLTPLAPAAARHLATQYPLCVRVGACKTVVGLAQRSPDVLKPHINAVYAGRRATRCMRHCVTLCLALPLHCVLHCVSHCTLHCVSHRTLYCTLHNVCTCPGVASMMDSTGDECVHLALEVIPDLVPVAPEAAAAVCGHLAPRILGLWGSCMRDPLLGEACMDALEALARLPSCNGQLEVRGCGEQIVLKLC